MSLSYIIRGKEYSLSDGNLMDHIGNDMFGMAPLERFEERGPMQHGSTDDGYRLLPRIVPVALAIEGQDYPDLFVKRAEVLAIFKPLDEAGVLRWVSGSVVRDLEVVIAEGPTFSTSDRKGLIQLFGLMFKANDPTWFDPIAITITFAPGSAGSGTPVPTPVPTPVGGSTLGEAATIAYIGSAPSYPYRIQINGPIANPIIENISTGQILDFTGTTLGVGEYIIMDLRYGHKTVFDQNGNTVVHLLTNDSDLSSFHIAPDPEVGGGYNEIRVSGSGTNDITSIDFVLFNRFIGV